MQTTLRPPAVRMRGSDSGPRTPIEFRERCAAAIFVGILFTFAGTTFLGFGVATFFRGREAETLTVVAVTAAGLLMSSVGIALALGRRGAMIDPSRRTVTTWWGLLVPWHSRVQHSDAYQFVTLERAVVRRNNSTGVIYPLGLEGPRDRAALYRFDDYAAARQRAEEVARALRLSMRDTTTGEAQVRSRHSLDEPLTARLREERREAVWPEAPDGLRIKYRTDESGVVFEIPGVPEGGLRVIIPVIAMMSVLAAAVTFFLVWKIVTPLWAEASPRLRGFVGLLGVWISAAPALAVVVVMFFRRSAERVIVSRGGVSVERRRPIGLRRWDFPADELEEIVVRRASSPLADGFLNDGALIARSDRDVCEIARTASDAEREWLRGAIEYVLIHGDETPAG
jgi:hypothetical protein